MAASDQKAFDASTVEDVKQDSNIAQPLYHKPLPDCLQHKSEAEISSLRRGLVRKADFRLMPVLIILFLLK